MYGPITSTTVSLGARWSQRLMPDSKLGMPSQYCRETAPVTTSLRGRKPKLEPNTKRLMNCCLRERSFPPCEFEGALARRCFSRPLRRHLLSLKTTTKGVKSTRPCGPRVKVGR